MSKYILIVDDNESDRVLTSFLVEQLGFIPITAKDGFVAVEKFDEFPFAAFIIDLQMPMMTGLELLQRVRQNKSYLKTPILILSARREELDVKKAIRKGANDYIIKPTDPDIFKEKLKALVGESEGWHEYSIAADTVGTLHEQVDLQSISEVGITYYQKSEPRIGDTRNISSAWLEKNALVNMLVCIRSFELEGRRYRVKATFVGLPESAYKKLRKLCKDLWLESQLREAKV